MNQYSFENKELILKVRKSPAILRFVLFFIAALFFVFPLFGLIFTIIQGDGVKFVGILVLGIFSLIGFYVLRVSLWNQYGEEKFKFNDDQIVYIADYRLFKDGKKCIGNTDIMYFIKPIGYEDENKGVLVISNGKSEIESVVKMPKQNLEKLIHILEADN